MNPIINLEKQVERILKKGEFIAIRGHNTPGDNDSASHETNLPYCGGPPPEECLVWEDKLLKAFNGQGISMGPLRYIFTERLSTGGTKTTFHQAGPDIGIRTVDNFNSSIFGNDQTYITSICFLETKEVPT